MSVVSCYATVISQKESSQFSTIDPKHFWNIFLPFSRNDPAISKLTDRTMLWPHMSVNSELRKIIRIPHSVFSFYKIRIKEIKPFRFCLHFFVHFSKFFFSNRCCNHKTKNNNKKKN
jgi:hypothetical protein